MSKQKKVLKGNVIDVESNSTERKKEKREPDDSRWSKEEGWDDRILRS